MAIFNTRQTVHPNAGVVKAAVKASDTRQHARDTLQKRSVQLKRVSPLGPTR